MTTLRVLLLGDLVGAPGRAIFQKHIGRLRQELSIDALIVNGENSSGAGRGITPKTMHFFKHHGVDVVTTGNHIWHFRDINSYLAEHKDLLRPANYPNGCPGVGVTTFNCKGFEVAVVNLMGRVFMRDHVECPFKTAQSLLTYLKHKTNIIFVDFHAEATSEKYGLAYFLDGSISGLVGTHTHTQTADERILPGGTAYISDLGMSGALNSMLGMKKDAIIHNFLTQMPVKFTVEDQGPMFMCGAVIEVDTQSGKALSITRLRIDDEAVQIVNDEKD